MRNIQAPEQKLGKNVRALKVISYVLIWIRYSTQWFYPVEPG